MEELFKTTNELDFYFADSCITGFYKFRVGTCSGVWSVRPESYDIIAIVNDEPGNGHLQDVFEWFENSCRRDKKDLRVMELWNREFREHLLTKRGFEAIPGTNHVIKHFR